ncbi:MAG TPA: hypothetical protein VJ894_01965 [Cryomorphaceae bacterium]|nr:hypothetical protein [Cryomorphaceae bacterium]
MIEILRVFVDFITSFYENCQGSTRDASSITTIIIYKDFDS